MLTSNETYMQSYLVQRYSTHAHVYGKHFKIESDHKPLEMIQLKNFTSKTAENVVAYIKLQHENHVQTRQIFYNTLNYSNKTLIAAKWIPCDY